MRPIYFRVLRILAAKAGSAFPYLLVFIVSLILSAIPKLAYAQWQPLVTFPGPVCTVYFMDQVGKPNIGFVSADDNQSFRNDTVPYLWKTTDFGITWREILIPPADTEPWLREGARDFTFKDSFKWLDGKLHYF